MPDALDEEFDRWDAISAVVVVDDLPGGLPEIWPVIVARHPGACFALVRIQGQQDILAMMVDAPVTREAACGWLSETRMRYEGAKPMNWLSGEPELPGVWYVFGVPLLLN